MTRWGSVYDDPWFMVYGSCHVAHVPTFNASLYNLHTYSRYYNILKTLQYSQGATMSKSKNPKYRPQLFLTEIETIIVATSYILAEHIDTSPGTTITGLDDLIASREELELITTKLEMFRKKALFGIYSSSYVTTGQTKGRPSIEHTDSQTLASSVLDDEIEAPAQETQDEKYDAKKVAYNKYRTSPNLTFKEEGGTHSKVTILDALNYKAGTLKEELTTDEWKVWNAKLMEDLMSRN